MKTGFHICGSKLAVHRKPECGRKPSGREEAELREAVHSGMGNRPGDFLNGRKLNSSQLYIRVNG